MKTLIISLIVFVSVPAFAQKKTPTTQPTIQITKKTSDVISHDGFEKVLKKFVDTKGQVNYKALKKDRKALDTYLKEVASATLSGSKDAKLAYYINAYNAIVIQSILDHKLKSVMKIKGFFKKKKHNLAGKKITLDFLENGIIRKEFSEARIHFLLVCGAKSCPRLRQEAATESNLQKMLEASAKEFVKKSTKVKKNKVTTSQLFNWFKGDFEKSAGSLGEFLAKYLPEHAKVLASKKTKFKFSKYSWKLNKQ